MKKKGVVRGFSLMLGFAIAFLMIFFIAIFMQNIGKTEILDKIDNFTTGAETQLGISEEMKTHIHSLPDDYNDKNIPYDLFFVACFILMYSSALYISYTAKENNMFKFFGVLYIGMIGFLFVTGIVNLIILWFNENLIVGFVGFDLSTTPIINFYLTNLTILHFVLGLILIIVNKLTFTDKREDDGLINSQAGRFQE